MLVAADDVVAIEYDSHYGEFIDDNPSRRCDICKDISLAMYELISGMVLCHQCYEAWDGNPEWLDLIALVTEAENVT